MRKIIDLQMEFWKKDIADIKFNLKSRDEIPKLLIGLQYIYCTPTIRNQIFIILKQIVPDKSHATGRPGMDLWKILVLGTVRLNSNCDYDKVHDMANNHFKIRQMLGDNATPDNENEYALQTIKDNVSLLTPEILNKINNIVVKTGHSVINQKQEHDLKGSCDSFVVLTNVHYPTDTNLLFDAIRKMITLIARTCTEIGVQEWRQNSHILRKVKSILRSIQLLKRSKSKNSNKKEVREKLIVSKNLDYIIVCQDLIIRSNETISILRELDLLSTSQEFKMVKVEEFIEHAERQIDPISERVIFDEKIPHKEKVFSIFEPHTEWISKGKAGVSQELGLKVCVLKDQHGFILHHHVMEKQTDDKVAVSMVQETKENFNNLTGCSFDKGFYSPDNKEKLAEILKFVVLPKKGRLSKKDKQIEHSKEFIEYRRKHSAVESSINALENHGLDRCPDHGINGFKRYVSLSVLARNLQILGHKIQEKNLKREKRRKAA